MTPDPRTNQPGNRPAPADDDANGTVADLAHLRASVATALHRIDEDTDRVLLGIAQSALGYLAEDYDSAADGGRLVDMLGTYQLALRRGEKPGRYVLRQFPRLYQNNPMTVLEMLAAFGDAHHGTGLGDLTEAQVFRIAQHIGRECGTDTQVVFPARYGDLAVGDSIYLVVGNDWQRVTGIDRVPGGPRRITTTAGDIDADPARELAAMGQLRRPLTDDQAGDRA